MSFIADLQKLVAESPNPLLAVNKAWTRVRLRDVASILNGYAFKSSQFLTDRGTPLIRIRDLETGSTITRYQGDYDPRYLVQRGDILVGMDGDFKVAEWSGEPALLNQRVCKITVSEDVYDSRFLRLALPGYLDAIHEATSSQTVKHLSSKDIAEIPLPRPPLAEQRRIVEKVEALLARGHAARKRLNAGFCSTEKLRRSIIAAACSGELSRSWALASIPTGTRAWTTQRLGVMFHIATGATPLRKNVYYYRDGDVPWVKSGAVNDLMITEPDEYITKLALKETNAKVFPKGTLLVAMYGEGATRGKVAELGIEAATNQALAAILFDDENASLRPFVKLLLRNRYNQSREDSAGGVQPNLSLQIIRDIEVAIPTAPERIEILRRVEVLMHLLDAVDRRIIGTSARAETFFQAVLAKAFAGELVPTEAELAKRENRDYEPASALLERMRQEPAIQRGVKKPQSRRR